MRIAGQIGREPGQAHIAAGTDAGTQWRMALSNVVAVLKAAGGEPRHLVALRAPFPGGAARLRDRHRGVQRRRCGHRRRVGRDARPHFPAMTLVQVSALIDPHAKVEIEGDAILP